MKDKQMPKHLKDGRWVWVWMREFLDTGYRIHDAGFRILRVGIPRGLEGRMYQIPKCLNA